MSQHHVESHYDAEWIRTAYFSDPVRRLTIAAGDVLMRPGDHNNRLYYIESGAVTGYRETSLSDEPLEFFHLQAGTYLGLHSFFSKHYQSYASIVAEEPTTLAWIDSDTQPVHPERYGSLADQFMPVIVGELYQRQMRILDAAQERSDTMRHLYQAEKMTTLGQLAAGLAHELNNAIGVISRNADQLTDFLHTELSQRFARELRWFQQGLERGQHASSQVTRRRAADYRQRFSLNHEQAKQLARMAPDEVSLAQLGPGVVNDLASASRFWQAGRDSHDMQRAARHAEAIVRSVKNLGRSDQQRDQSVDVQSTLEEALSLLHSDLRQVDIRLKFGLLSPIQGNASELVQVWVNLIKNACDAMQHGMADTPPVLSISSVQKDQWCKIEIRDNGLGIPGHLLDKIFEPSFTTKKTGLSFGLGLGLAIVARIIDAHAGLIHVSSEPGNTCFQVLLPSSEVIKNRAVIEAV